MAVPSLLQAQDEMETLFNKDITHGGFGAPMVKVSSVAGEPGVWVGGRGAWFINIGNGHAISLGGGGFGLATEHEVPDPDYGEAGQTYYAENGYGGFEFEYYNRTHKLVHLTVSSMIGGGTLRAQTHNDSEWNNDDADHYFVVEPGAHLELNITHFFRISAGVTYRITRGISRAGFTDEDFTGITGMLTLKFGQLQ